MRLQMDPLIYMISFQLTEPYFKLEINYKVTGADLKYLIVSWFSYKLYRHAR